MMTFTASLDPDTNVAIVGLAGRFPGASDVDRFWENLCGGVESITRFSDEELLAAGVSPTELADPSYVKAGAVLDGVELFDADFFGIPPREAQLIDPQQRLFLETAWTALESAGCDPSRFDGAIGVYAGSALSTYLLNNVAGNADVLRSSSEMQVALGNDKDSLATLTAYAFDLRGPAYNIQSYCSTSLVAVAGACSGLIAGECDMALAGGVAISVPHRVGYTYQEGGIASPDGSCRAFDAAAKGSPLGNGVGVVVLKRLADALADGDTVHAVIRGWAVNNDGALKVGYTAPGVRGQAAVIAEAMENAGLTPDEIDYVEAHGTGTALGDAAEFAALTRAFDGVAERGGCALGSVKTNVGHLDRAAGVTGLIKTTLAMEHGLLPPTLHFREANPQIDMANSPFRVNAELTEWKRRPGLPRRAGVSAFGIGGTNVHVVLEEAPAPTPGSPGREQHVLPLSARTEAAADARARDLADHLEQHPDADLADVAYTLQVGRKPFEHRRCVIASSVQDAVRTLREPGSPRLLGSSSAIDNRPVGLVFAGVGEQYEGMAAGLFASEPVFRSVVDECARVVDGLLGVDLRGLLCADRRAGGVDLRAVMAGEAPAADGLVSTVVAQPAVFVVEYALARLLAAWGVRAEVLAGYSVGEYVAATLAGVLSLEDALRLVVERARLIEALPGGVMVAVSLPVAEAVQVCGDELDVAAVNGPRMCVLAGPEAAAAAAEARLAERGVAFRRLATTHAFHSRMLEPVADRLTAWVAEHVRLAAPRVPYVSNVTGTWITPEQATDPGYWARHMCATVRFQDTAGALLEDTDRLLVEVGPGQSLGALVRQHPACTTERMGLIVPTLPARQDPTDAADSLQGTLARLWLAGVSIDWHAHHGEHHRRRIPLPTYPFQRDRYWIDPPTATTHAAPIAVSACQARPAAAAADPRTALTSLPRQELDDWLYVPAWRQTAPLAAGPVTADGPFLVFADDSGVADAVVDRLRAAGAATTYVTTGDEFSGGGATFVIRPGSQEDHARVVDEMRKAGGSPRSVLHLWALDEPSGLEHCYLSPLWLAQALGAAELERRDILIASSAVHDVTGADPVRPDAALVVGPAKVIPLELPGVSCRHVDVERPASVPDAQATADRLLAELAADPAHGVVAWRKGRRWLQAFEPLPAPASDGGPLQLRERGVYAITGGLGGIGLGIAQRLARDISSRLVLLSRSGLPPREEWPSLTVEAGAPAELARRIDAVRELEATGAEVLVCAADVGDADALRAAFAEATQRFGGIDGVIHAAGLPGMGLLQFRTPDNALTALAPKVAGTRVLEEVIREIGADFLVLFSSITSITGGGPGQVDYCAANAYMDAVAQRSNGHGPRILSIGWGEWQWNAWDEGLSGYHPEVRRFFENNRRTFGISFDEGWEAFRRALAAAQPHVIVSTQDFRRLVELSGAFTIETVLSHGQSAARRHTRPDLGTPFTAPSTEVEHTIAELWSEALGLTEVGVHDNFFELGGNSLLGVDLMARMCRRLGRDPLPPHVLYLAPTVHTLAQIATGNEVQEWVDDRRDRGSARRENLRSRARAR
jgi:acyl transferase domain-containing protein